MLDAYTEYKFFVRAWYDADTYATFESNCVTIVPFPPTLQTIGGVGVKEHITPDDPKEADFVNDPSQLPVSWTDKFTDHADFLEEFEVALGTFCGGSLLIIVRIL